MADTSPAVTMAVERTDLRARISELGQVLSTDYSGRDPVIVGVLTGSLWFVADLVRAMSIDVAVDFLALNRFGDGGRIRIAMDTADPLTGRDVIIVEDIVDTGLSLTVLRRLLLQREPGSLATCTLFDKTSRRLVDVPLEYRGFEVGDEYLVGYGLDFGGRYRNLPDVWAVLDFEAFTSNPDSLAEELLPGG